MEDSSSCYHPGLAGYAGHTRRRQHRGFSGRVLLAIPGGVVMGIHRLSEHHYQPTLHIQEKISRDNIRNMLLMCMNYI